MYRKAILFTLVSILALTLSACGGAADSPTEPPVSAPTDPEQPAPVVGDPSIPPLPKDWMQVPNTIFVYYGTSSFDVEDTNTRVNARSWVMVAAEDDFRDFESFSNAVNVWYQMQVDTQDDFERIDDAYFTWGEAEIRIEADIGVEGEFEVLFTISEREPIDPNEPMG
jgi:hypothetical protein